MLSAQVRTERMIVEGQVRMPLQQIMVVRALIVCVMGTAPVPIIRYN